MLTTKEVLEFMASCPLPWEAVHDPEHGWRVMAAWPPWPEQATWSRVCVERVGGAIDNAEARSRAESIAATGNAWGVRC
jgi:hypothetical protein